VKTLVVPKLEANEILIKVSAIALNPTDWKSLQRVPAGLVSGCDFCGNVVALGQEASSGLIKIDDKVAGFVHGARYPNNGAFAEYVKTEVGLVWKVPNVISYEEGAAIGGIASQTAVQGICMRLGLPIPDPKSPVKATGKTILIWAGSTSVGIYAIQLAKLCGLKVVTTASKKNHDLLKSFGADACFDYKDSEVVKKIKDYAGDSLVYGFDCIGEKNSTDLVALTFGSSGGKIITLLSPHIDHDWPSNVTSEQIYVYTVLGKPIPFDGKELPAMPKDKAAIGEWLSSNVVTELVASGKFKSNPLRRCPGSLERVEEGLQYLKAGKVSAEKLVYSVVDSFNPVPEPLV